MIPGQFEYVRPAGLQRRCGSSPRRGRGEGPLGRLQPPATAQAPARTAALLVDIRDVDGLAGIVETDDGLGSAARATHRQILEDPAVRARYPLLTDAAGGIGDPQVRNWGTIGGSAPHGRPIAPTGQRSCSASSGDAGLPRRYRPALGARRRLLHRHFPDPAIQLTELLIEVPRPALAEGQWGAYYAKLTPTGRGLLDGGRLRGDGPIAADGTIGDAAIGLTAVADSPFASAGAAAALIGARPSEATFRAAGAAAAIDRTRPATLTARRLQGGRWSRR